MEGSNETSQNQTGNNQTQSGFTDPVFAQEIHVAHENNPQNNAQNMNINPPQNNAGNNNINNYNNMQPQFQDRKNLGNDIPTHNLNKDNNGPHVLDSFSQFTDKGQIEELSHRNQNQNNGPNQPNVNNSLSIFNQDNQQNMPSQNKSNANNNNNNNNPTLNSNELNSSNFNEFNLLKTYKTKIKENTNQTGDNQPLANHSNQQNEPTYSQKQINDIQSQNMNNNNPINSQNQGIIGNNNNALNSNAVIGNSTNNNMLNNQISNQAIINNDNQNLNNMNNFNKNENVMNNSLSQKNDNVGNSQNNNMSINNNNNNQQNPQLNISKNPPEVNNQNNPPQVNPFYQNNQPNNNMNNQMGNNNMNDQIGNNNMNNQMGSINMNDKQVNNNPMGINNQNNQLGNNNINNPIGNNSFNNPIGNNNFNNKMGHNNINNPMGNNNINNPMGNNNINNPMGINNFNNQMGNNNINNPMGNNNFNNPMGNNNFNNPMGINNQNNQLANMNAQSNNNNNFNKPTNPEVQPQQQNNKPGEEEYRFTRYKKPALTVLKNLGNTSYLNAVLQLFGTVRNLASYFVNPKNRKYFEEHLKEIPLAFVFHRLFLHLYPYPEKATGEKYNPEVLLQILGQYNAVYKSKAARNPNDLINFILIQMHRELNTNKIKYINEPDCTKKEQVIKIGMEDFVKSNKSILANNFIWFEIKTKLCPSCKTCYYEFNHFETLELNIVSAYQKFNAPLNLCQTLFYQNQKNQKIYCLREQQYTMANVTSKIYSPIYFIFSLNRGNFDTNLMKIPFNLEQEIDISKLLDNPQSYKKFELIGVVSISTAENKKYVCFGRSPVNYKWYLYNDDHSAENTDINNVVHVHNSGQYIPCILMYQCKK
jgi:ubiquitin C-terminal hydrolase